MVASHQSQLAVAASGQKDEQMSVELGQIWSKAQETYMASLNDKERRRIATVTTQESLLDHTKTLQKAYNERSLTKRLSRMSNFIESLKSFENVIKIFIQADPKISALVWGSISYTIELASRHEKHLDCIADAFERFDRALPRFHRYIARFGDQAMSQRMRNAVSQYYAEVIGICQDAIFFFKNHPIVNILIGPFRPLQKRLNRRVTKIEELRQWVDQEATATSDEVAEARQEAQHHELMQNFGKNIFTVRRRRYHNLPVQNPSFFGREDLMNKLINVLVPSMPAKTLMKAALCGLGGAGKTQLALHYAYTYLDEYDSIYWVEADNMAKISASIAGIARAIGLGQDNSEREDQLREKFKTFLYDPQTQESATEPLRWLLIFNNVDEPRLLAQYWPSGCRGTVIVTARDAEVARQFTGIASKIDVAPFTVKEGQQFLLTRSGPENIDEGVTDEPQSALAISQALGGLPLALSLLGGYIAASCSSFTTFLENRPSFETDFLFTGSFDQWTAQGYQRSIDKTWTFDLNEIGKAPKHIMETLAFLDADGTDESLFLTDPADGMKWDGIQIRLDYPELGKYLEDCINSREVLDGAMIELVKRSLISRSPKMGRLSCHRLVQLAVINAMAPQEKRLNFNRALFYINGSFPSQPSGAALFDQWEVCEQLFRQVSSLLEVYGRLQAEIGFPLLLSSTVVRCAWFLLEKGQFELAQSMTNSAVKMCENALESAAHPGYIPMRVREFVTFLYTVQAAIKEERDGQGAGLELCLRVYEMRLNDVNEECLDSDLMWLGLAEGNIAEALLGAGQVEQALRIFQRLLCRQDLTTHRNLWLLNIANCYHVLTEFEKTRSYAQQVLEALQASEKPDLAQKAQAFFILGKAYRASGQLDNAREAISQCLTIRQNSLPFHQYTGLTYHKLGEIFRELHDLQSALLFFKQGFDILSVSEYGCGARCRTAFELAELYSQLGKSDESEKYYELGREYRQSLTLDQGEELSTSPAIFDRFVGIANR